MFYLGRAVGNGLKSGILGISKFPEWFPSNFVRFPGTLEICFSTLDFYRLLFSELDSYKRQTCSKCYERLKKLNQSCLDVSPTYLDFAETWKPVRNAKSAKTRNVAGSDPGARSGIGTRSDPGIGTLGSKNHHWDVVELDWRR